MGKSLEDKFYDFALTIIKLVQALPKDIVAKEIGKQLLRAGTSIAANYEEARGAFSKEDFTYKIGISFKEARETNLWLRLLKDSGVAPAEILDPVIQESEEIRNILGKSLSTARKKNRN